MCGFFIEYRKKNTMFDRSRFLTNAEKLSRCGADILVAGSSVFRAPSISEAITALHG